MGRLRGLGAETFYAWITKGLTAIGAAMILAAERAGAAAALKQELPASQPQILARLSKSLPDMYPKAYRWVDEMRFIAEFIGATFPEAGIFGGAAGLYQRLAEHVAGAGEERTSLDVFLTSKPNLFIVRLASRLAVVQIVPAHYRLKCQSSRRAQE
jgi:hypothetical protein